MAELYRTMHTIGGDHPGAERIDRNISELEDERVSPGLLARGQRPPLAKLLRAGTRFERGVLIERDEVTAA